MVRVLVPGVLALALSACGSGSSVTTAGFADGGSSLPSLAPAYSDSGATPIPEPANGGEPRDARVRTAKLDDRAPAGSFESAPKGSLADRDYSRTRLDSSRARDLVNQYRRAKGLKPLTLDPELTKAAEAHARDLAKWDRISHFGSDGSNPWDRVNRTGYGARVTAENVGTGQATFEEVLKGWKDSPGHNKNLLMNDAQHMGIALVQDTATEFKSFWTLVLAAK